MEGSKLSRMVWVIQISKHLSSRQHLGDTSHLVLPYGFKPVSNFIPFYRQREPIAYRVHQILKDFESRKSWHVWKLWLNNSKLLKSTMKERKITTPTTIPHLPPPAPSEPLTFGEPKVHFSFLISIAWAISSQSSDMSSRYANDTSRVISAFSSARARRHQAC